MLYHYNLIIVDPYFESSQEIETEFPTLEAIQGYLEGRYKIESGTNGWINGIDSAMSIRDVYAFSLDCLVIVIHREDNCEDDADRYDKEMQVKKEISESEWRRIWRNTFS